MNVARKPLIVREADVRAYELRTCQNHRNTDHFPEGPDDQPGE